MEVMKRRYLMHSICTHVHLHCHCTARHLDICRRQGCMPDPLDSRRETESCRCSPQTSYRSSPWSRTCSLSLLRSAGSQGVGGHVTWRPVGRSTGRWCTWYPRSCSASAPGPQEPSARWRSDSRESCRIDIHEWDIDDDIARKFAR